MGNQTRDAAHTLTADAVLARSQNGVVAGMTLVYYPALRDTNGQIRRLVPLPMTKARAMQVATSMVQESIQ